MRDKINVLHSNRNIVILIARNIRSYRVRVHCKLPRETFTISRIVVFSPEAIAKTVNFPPVLSEIVSQEKFKENVKINPTYSCEAHREEK